MITTNDNNDSNLRRSWIRIWVILIPTWIVALIAVWFLIGNFLYKGTSADHKGVVINQQPAPDINIMPASGPKDK